MSDDSYTTPTGEWVGASLPTVINATKVITYTVADIVKDIVEARQSSEWVNSSGETGGHASSLEVTLEEVIEWVEEYAKDDFACGWGHTADLVGVIFTDDNGTPL